MTIEAVIFDIGNVLIEWQPERFYDARIGEARRREIFAGLDLHAMNDRIDRGENFRAVVEETAQKHPHWQDEIMMWHDDWDKMASPAIQDSVTILRRLRADDVPVFALSNFGIETFEIAEPIYPFLREFDRRYISGHMAVTKPAARIYQMVEDDCGVSPDKLLFTDDRQENLDAAQVRGWQTHLFTSPQEFAKRLIDDALLPRSFAL